jgi:hypothetical protein
MEQRATLKEIETHWSIDDLQAANIALDLWHKVNAPPKDKP